jgi:hypothetical protein
MLAPFQLDFEKSMEQAPFIAAFCPTIRVFLMVDSASVSQLYGIEASIRKLGGNIVTSWYGTICASKPELNQELS